MHTLITTALLTVLIGVALAGVGALFGRLHPLVDLFGQFLLSSLMAAAALALLAVLLGRYALAGVSIGALLINLAIAWPSLKEPEASGATGPRFKLMLLNVFYYNPRIDLTVDLVRRSKADVVVLLEIVPRLRSQFAALDAEYPYRLECWQRPLCDALIYSRFPITDISASLPPAQTRRSLASATVDVGGRKLTLFAAHLTLPFPFRRLEIQPAQAADLASSVAAVAGPRLLVGDFNAATWSASVGAARDKAGLSVLTGAGGTWPTFLPRHMSIPIDHVLASSELALESRKLLPIYGSDHRAVLAGVAFRE